MKPPQRPISSRARAVAVAAIAAVATTAAPAGATATTDVPTVRSTLRVVLAANGIVAPAQISFDIGMVTNAGQTYYPCANTVQQDPLVAACSVGNYYHVVNVAGSGDLVNGLPIYNQDKGYTHNWSQRVSVANLEITAQDAAGEYGKARLTMSGFTIPFEPDPTRQLRTKTTGIIPLPRLGDSDAARVAGYVTRNGLPTTSKVNINYFGHTDTGHVTGSGNWTAYGLGGASNIDATTDQANTTAITRRRPCGPDTTT
jgi:hypothetical protein